MSRPHVEQFDRDAIDDRGLVNDDATEDMRPNKSAPETPVRQHQAGTDPNQQSATESR